MGKYTQLLFSAFSYFTIFSYYIYTHLKDVQLYIDGLMVQQQHSLPSFCAYHIQYTTVIPVLQAYVGLKNSPTLPGPLLLTPSQTPPEAVENSRPPLHLSKLAKNFGAFGANFYEKHVFF